MMGTWRKAPPELVELFTELVEEHPELDLRKMFGYPCAFVAANNQMLTGVHQENIMLRLSEKDRAWAAEQGAIPFEPMPGRRMREYVVIPYAVVGSVDELRAWLERGLAYAETLPVKVSKRRKTTK